MNNWENALANWPIALAVFVIIDILCIGGMLFQGIGSDVKAKNKRKFYSWSIGIINLLSFLAAISIMLWYKP